MKTVKCLAVLATAAILGAGCGNLEDGRLCQDHDGVLMCEPADGSLDSRGQALFDSGGFSSGHSYICEDTAEGRTCTCMGFFDCLWMAENACVNRADIDCPEGGSTFTCTCEGKPASTTDGIGTSPYLPGDLASQAVLQ